MRELTYSFRYIPLVALALGFVAASSMGVASCEGPGKVGNATCLSCHDGRSASDARGFLLGQHKNLACESCHGPGYAHVRNGGRGGLLIENPGKTPFATAYQLCQKCHATMVPGYLQSKHFTEGAATCNDCHNVHTASGLIVPTSNGSHLDTASSQALCGRCHKAESDDFAQSKHAELGVATCASCHNPHAADTNQGSPITNEMCLQCHDSFQLGFDTDAAIQAHVGAQHPLDPAGTGAGRCTACHLPPAQLAGQPNVAHRHTLKTIPPSATNADIQAGVNPLSPNSCSGVMGCHDAGTPGSGTPYDITSEADNAFLQTVYDTIGLTP